MWVSKKAIFKPPKAIRCAGGGKGVGLAAAGAGSEARLDTRLPLQP